MDIANLYKFLPSYIRRHSQPEREVQILINGKELRTQVHQNREFLVKCWHCRSLLRYFGSSVFIDNNSNLNHPLKISVECPVCLSSIPHYGAVWSEESEAKMRAEMA